MNLFSTPDAQQQFNSKDQQCKKLPLKNKTNKQKNFNTHTQRQAWHINSAGKGKTNTGNKLGQKG